MTPFDDFSDWAAPAAAQNFTPAKNLPRRLGPLTVTWRGEVIRFEPTERLMFGQKTMVLGLITIWPPTTDPEHPWPRKGWTADVLVHGFGFVVGRGDTPQAALDALSAELPNNATAMVRGGSC